MTMNQREGGKHTFPACLLAEDAAKYMGWPPYFMAMLARSGHLKPLGKPAQNSHKWYARVELEALAQDRNWLDKAIHIVERRVREKNNQEYSQKPGSLSSLQNNKPSDIA